MGNFSLAFEVGNPADRRFVSVEAMVDTGATYTFLPQGMLEALGVQPTEQREFILADGRHVDHGLAWVQMRIAGKEEPSLVIFGDRDSEPLLGAYTLEGFGFGVDPVNKCLIPVPGYLVGIREAR